MYKKIINAILVIVCLTAIVGLGGCAENQHKFGRKRIKEITEIEVPIDSKILFHYIDNSFVNGRAEQLTVFEFESEPTDWLKENKFLRSDDETLIDDEGDFLVNENQSYFWDYFNNETYNGQKVPEEYIPNFIENYRWLRKNRVHFFYYPETLRLIVYITWS